ncbi:TonB-dependent siderophore receptor [Methylomonas albis]|nr:TonB-dependent receptor [Methylomonas albis]
MTSRTSNAGLQPSRLHQAIQHILLASALTVSTAAYAETRTDTANIRHSYHISGGSLGQALRQFATNSGLMYSAEAALTDGKTTAGLDGDYTAEEGLKRLLAGTGLTYTFTAEGAVAVRVAETGSNAASTLPAVTVTGKGVYDSTDPYNEDYRLPNSSTATKTDTPIMETPFSVQVVSKQVIQDRQAVRIDKAVENVSGVVQGGFNQGTSDGFLVRGFQNTNMYRDGLLMPTDSSTTTKRETANLERIEVLKGPGSLLYGRAEPGGIINLVTKQPLSTPFNSIQQQFGSYAFYRTSMDSTGPITKDDTLLYRLNLSYENSGSYRDFIDRESVFVAPVIKWNIDSRTQASFELEYQHYNTNQDVGIPQLGKRPAPIPINRSLEEPFNSKNNGDSILAGFNWSHEFNDNWKVVNKFMTQNYDNKDIRQMYIAGPAHLDGTVNRFFVNFPQIKAERYSTTINLLGKVNTWSTTHNLLFGFDYFNTKDTLNGINITTSPSVLNVFNPVYFTSQPYFEPANSFNISNTESWYGLYFQDQIDLPYDFHALGGFRYDNAQIRNNISGITSPTEDRLSPRGGLLWQPVNWLSLYGSYTENFGVSNVSSSSNGYNLPPQTAQQWETGIKTEFLDGKLRSTISYFNLTKQNLPVSIPGTFYYRALGAAETRGIEFDTTGEILPGWNVIIAYTYTPFAKIIKDVDSDGGTGNQGNKLFSVPRNSGSLWNTYEVQEGDLRGFKFGAGLVGVGERQGNIFNTYQLPGYVTVNLMTSYQMKVGSSKITTQLNVDNILDKTYYAGTQSTNQIQFGAPLTFMGSIRADF